MTKYMQRKDGEGFDVPAGTPVRWACCDCGLVHDLVFVNGRGKVGVAARRNNRATGQRRRRVKLNAEPSREAK